MWGEGRWRKLEAAGGQRVVAGGLGALLLVSSRTGRGAPGAKCVLRQLIIPEMRGEKGTKGAH